MSLSRRHNGDNGASRRIGKGDREESTSIREPRPLRPPALSSDSNSATSPSSTPATSASDAKSAGWFPIALANDSEQGQAYPSRASSSASSIDTEILARIQHLDISARIVERNPFAVGYGGFSEVFRGVLRREDGEERETFTVAIKRLRFHVNELAVRKNFAQEIYIWSKLKHPNVLELLGFSWCRETHFPLLISEWMPLGTAWSYVTSHQELRSFDIELLLRDVAAGLAYLHEQGVIHSDMKADNVLMASDKRAVISDFGSARVQEVVEMSQSLARVTSTMKGTRTHWSPELLRGEKHCEDSDVWAFGMTVFEMFVRQRPFKGMSEVQIILAVIEGKVPEIPTVFDDQSDLEHMCRQCWVKPPLTRPKAKELHQRLIASTKIPSLLEAASDLTSTLQELQANKVHCTELGTQCVVLLNAVRREKDQLDIDHLLEGLDRVDNFISYCRQIATEWLTMESIDILLSLDTIYSEVDSLFGDLINSAAYFSFGGSSEEIRVTVVKAVIDTSALLSHIINDVIIKEKLLQDAVTRQKVLAAVERELRKVEKMDTDMSLAEAQDLQRNLGKLRQMSDTSNSTESQPPSRSVARRTTVQSGADAVADSAAPTTGAARPSGKSICGRCSLPMTGAFVRAFDDTFHLQCFKCIECGVVVAKKFFPIDGPDGKQLPMCERDFFSRLNLICAECDQALRGSYITACGKKYHVDHFTCTACPKRFGPQDSYYEHEDKIYCHFHYATRFASKCEGCDSPILKQFVEIKRNDRPELWDAQCYMINKFWNVRMKYSGRDEDPPASTWVELEAKETPETLKDKQDWMERRVNHIWTVLSSYEETSAACISDMLRSVSKGTFLEMMHFGQRFLFHIEVLFAAIDDLELKTIEVDTKGLSHVREARLLCRKIVDFFSLVSSNAERTGDMGMSVTKDLLAVVTGIAHYLKLLIRIALKGSLRLEALHKGSDALAELLNKLDDFAKAAKDQDVRRLTSSEPGSSSYVPLSTYNIQNFAPLLDNNSSLSKARADAIGLEWLQNAMLTDLCVKCKKTVEESCARLGAFHRWHSSCLACGVCGKAARPPKASGVIGTEESTKEAITPPKLTTSRKRPAEVGMFVYDRRYYDGPTSDLLPHAILCLEHSNLNCTPGFEAVSRLEQYVFLLNVAFRKLGRNMYARGLLSQISPTSETNSDRNTTSMSSGEASSDPALPLLPNIEFQELELEALGKGIDPIKLSAFQQVPSEGNGSASASQSFSGLRQSLEESPTWSPALDEVGTLYSSSSQTVWDITPITKDSRAAGKSSLRNSSIWRRFNNMSLLGKK